MNIPDTIVLISVDDLRYDAIGASELNDWLADYKALPWRDTPTFDNLVNEGCFFRQSTSTSSYTPPSHASMFTGRYPTEHGVKTFFTALDSEVVTMADILGNHGYETSAWVENQALEMLNVTQGFDEVICPFTDPDNDLFNFVNDALTGEGKTFLFIHLFDVHKPYRYTTGGKERHNYNEKFLNQVEDILPKEVSAIELKDEAKTEAQDTLDNYEELSESLQEYAHAWSLDYLIRVHLEEAFGEERFEFLIKLYLAGVADFDQGRFRDLLNHLNATIDRDYLTLVTSDHGEAICEWQNQRDFMNSFNVSEQAVRVPLILETDILDLPSASDVPVSHIDLLPTVADAIGVNLSQKLPGTSLFDLANKDEPNRMLFHESWYYEGGVDFFGTVSDDIAGGLSEVAVRSYPYKLTTAYADTGNPDIALYDLSNDPFEERNLYKDIHSDTLRTALDEHIGNTDITSVDGSDEVDDDLKGQLEALGYI